MTSSDLKAVYTTATATLFNGPSRLRSIHYVSTTGGGSLVFKDGTATAVTLQLAVPAAHHSASLELPDRGVRFDTAMKVTTLTSGIKLTVFHS
jgi:hypothetical protein